MMFRCRGKFVLAFAAMLGMAWLGDAISAGFVRGQYDGARRLSSTERGAITALGHVRSKVR